MNLWLKNTSGKRDAVLTLAVFSTVMVILKVLLAGVTLTWGTKVFNLGIAPDASTIGALLTPTLGAYVARRLTDAKYAPPVAADTAQPSQPVLPSS